MTKMKKAESENQLMQYRRQWRNAAQCGVAASPISANGGMAAIMAMKAKWRRNGNGAESLVMAIGNQLTERNVAYSAASPASCNFGAEKKAWRNESAHESRRK
jgi:hypothetical protein